MPNVRTRFLEEIEEKYPDRFKMVCEAMKKTKGKADNNIVANLLFCEGVTVEDLIKFSDLYRGFHEDEEGPLNGSWVRHVVKNVFWSKSINNKRTSDARKVMDIDKFRYSFEDTYLYRFMEKEGLLDKRKNYSRKEFSVLITDPYQDKISDTNEADTVKKFITLDKETREAVIANEYTNSIWNNMRMERVYNTNSDPDLPTNSEWEKEQIAYVAETLKMIVNAPEDAPIPRPGTILGGRECDVKNVPNLWDCILTRKKSYNDRLYKPENRALLTEAFSIMKYIGIGVAWRYDEKNKEWGASYYSRSARNGVMNIPRRMSGAMRRFIADIRKGFSAEDARTVLIEDLNMFSEKKLDNHWVFFARTDAPTEYPDIVKAKKDKEKEEKKEEEKE